jgi:hypothetical protein
MVALAAEAAEAGPAGEAAEAGPAAEAAEAGPAAEERALTNDIAGGGSLNAVHGIEAAHS